MAAGRHAFNEIVAEPLTKENQTAWFVCIKNFLIARDLWEVVEGTTKLSKNSVRWKRKNAEALHIMQISCTSEPFSYIMEVSEAKVAWDILRIIYKDKRTVIPPEMEAEEVDSTAARLYRAICENNWGNAQPIVENNPSVLSAKLTSKGSTALHVAALFRRVGMVEELVKLASQDDLGIVDVGGKTPLATAIYGGVTEIAKCMVNKNRKILSISTLEGHLPVSLAFAVGHKEMGRYLYSVTPLEDLTSDKGTRGLRLLYYCFNSGNLDIALDLLQRCENLLFAKDSHGWTPIEGIAAMLSAFPSGNQLVFWKRWISKCIYIPSTTTTNDVRIDIQPQNKIKRAGFRLLRRLIYCTYKCLGMKEIHDLKLFHAQATQIVSLVCKNKSFSRKTPYHVDIVRDALFPAAKEGTVEFVDEVVKANPELILFFKRGSWHIFFFAVQYRQAEIFRLIHGLPFKDVLTTSVDTSGNSMLHVAGMLAPSFRLNQIPGAALQMQSELQWFKEVESVIPPSIRLSKNNDGKRPIEVFKESHKELRKEGEEWIKGTASSCSVVGALVVTIMFAAAFTVPGGNNQESGYPIFLGKEKLFMVFIISDALSLFSSTTSVLMFLGILTSRYLEEDFLKSLPRKLIIGLSSLFISIATMMIAFSATILIMLEHRQSRALLPIILLASIPVTLFVLLQFPLLVQIAYSTYGPSIFRRNVKH